MSSFFFTHTEIKGISRTLAASLSRSGAKSWWDVDDEAGTQAVALKEYSNLYNGPSRIQLEELAEEYRHISLGARAYFHDNRAADVIGDRKAFRHELQKVREVGSLVDLFVKGMKELCEVMPISEDKTQRSDLDQMLSIRSSMMLDVTAQLPQVRAVGAVLPSMESVVEVLHHESYGDRLPGGFFDDVYATFTPREGRVPLPKEPEDISRWCREIMRLSIGLGT